jgi:hypothetical protein
MNGGSLWHFGVSRSSCITVGTRIVLYVPEIRESLGQEDLLISLEMRIVRPQGTRATQIVRPRLNYNLLPSLTSQCPQ